jgi:23S rRNA (cytosine1962-C5)-methyltransferase
MTKLFSPQNWKDYELIDTGGFEKLERFGKYILRRPEPQAVWRKIYSEAKWEKLAHARFSQKSSHKGEWVKKGVLDDQWEINYRLKNKKITLNLSFTAFKHVGIFPEQADNWEFIYNQVQRIGKNCRVLNLFAYTGGASLAAKAAGADVVHVDSVKQVISWAKRNMQSSRLNDIRWVVEDAMKFVEREARRGRTYNGIILDPPAYGIGAKGERWKLEEAIDPMLQEISKILDQDQHFLVLNTYSLGLSPIILENLIHSNITGVENESFGELFLHTTSGQKLPLGVLARFYK